MSGPHLLFVEDDEPTRRLVAVNLAAHGYLVDEAGTVRDATARWEARRPDLVLLDLGLPDRDGSVLVRRIRRDAATPILILSARGDERDKIAALEAGADDYVTKPFGLGELRARIAALLRRAAGPAADASGRMRVGSLVMDTPRRIVSVAGNVVDLTPREYELLREILAQGGRVATKARLLRAVWGGAYAEESHYLHVYVSRLRRKLDEAAPGHAAGSLIVAEPGVGYRIREPEEPGGAAD